MKTIVSLKYFVNGSRNIANAFKNLFENEIYCKKKYQNSSENPNLFLLFEPNLKKCQGLLLRLRNMFKSFLLQQPITRPFVIPLFKGVFELFQKLKLAIQAIQIWSIFAQKGFTQVAQVQISSDAATWPIQELV